MSEKDREGTTQRLDFSEEEIQKVFKQLGKYDEVLAPFGDPFAKLPPPINRIDPAKPFSGPLPYALRF